jgi:MFS family permease
MATAQRPLRRGEWVTLGLLGVPTFAFALAITTVSTYLPVVASSFAPSTVVIGALIGGEGLMALALPVLVGSWSDRLATPIGGRLPFVLGATPVVALGLALLGFVDSIGAAAFGLAIFFAGYFVAYEPYRALYPDLIDDRVAGRAQSTQAMARGVATAMALAAGGALLSVGTAVPFVLSAAVVVASVGAFGWAVTRRGVPDQTRREETGTRTMVRKLLELLRRHPELRVFLAANALWELSLAALKTFVVLYVTKSVGMSTAAGSLVVGAAAVVVLFASPVSGKLGDRVGRAKVMTWSLGIYGLGLLVPFASVSPAVLAGLAIQLAGTDYRAMWLVCGAAVLASIPLTRRLQKRGAD